MSQQRLRNYKHAILSFEHNIFNLGMHNPGRYCGFDTMDVEEGDGPQQVILYHTASGLQYKDPVNTTIGPIGVVLTPQGDIIMETEAIGPIAIDTNSGNSETRYDLVVMNHNHTVIVGGQPATYSIIKGPVGNPIKPVLTDPLKQVAIGVIELPPNASAPDTYIYTKSKSPDSGDGEDARLNDPNRFTAIQIDKKSSIIQQTPAATHTVGSVTNNFWDLKNDGNVFEIDPSLPPNTTITCDGFRIKDATLQDGARIMIRCNSKLIFRNSYASIPTYGPKGFKALKINQGMGNVIANAGYGVLGVQAQAGEEWELEFVLEDDYWYLAKIGGAGSQTPFRRGMCLMWNGDVAANFDGTGFGVNLMAGWQIANGVNNTPDMRGKIFAMGDNVPSVGATDITFPTIGSTPAEQEYLRGNNFTTTGQKSFIIDQANLPDYDLPVTDPGHFHNFPGQKYSSHPSGGSSSEYRDPDTQQTASAFTGITVNSGGDGERLYHTPPVFFTVAIQKL